jgi:hypothetical protein
MKPRQAFLDELTSRFGPLKRLGDSRSLYELADGGATVYVRYSRLHDGKSTFYGLREQDLRRLEGLTAFIAFLWESQPEPLLLPLDEFAGVFGDSKPAADGQIKVQVHLRHDGTELYVAQAGRHNVEPYFGWWPLVNAVERRQDEIPSLSHSQVQTLLGAIGDAHGMDIWVPPNDRARLDWSLASPFECRRDLPSGPNTASTALREIDVVWIRRGGSQLEALYEVEHSTPIYSGLLRFNDVYLSAGETNRFTIVSDDERRESFVRQLHRPTFRASGLSEVCGFMPYADVFRWYERIRGATSPRGAES